jgi:Fe-S-cluster-containing dehydrogenase component
MRKTKILRSSVSYKGSLSGVVFINTCSGRKEAMLEMGKRTSISRRTVLKGGCVLAACAALSGGYLAKVAEAAETAGTPKKQLAFWVDTQKCDNCLKCVDACRTANKTPEKAPARRKVAEYTNSAGEKVFITTSCMHCAVPSCANVCPAGAINKRDDGIVDIEPKRCIGCKYCFQACPFGVPHYLEVMDKCDCCLANGVEAGQPTECVKACPTGALNYGTIEELLAKSNGRAKALEAPSGPSFFLS